MTKPLRVSWSAIRSAEECKQKSFLQRSGKRAKISNIRNFWPGTVVDHVMRDWLARPDGSMAGLVEEVMEKSEVEEKERGNIVRFRNADDREVVRAFCTELCNRLEPILWEHVLPHSYQCGKWFKVPMQIDYRGVTREILLTGEMDLIVDHGEAGHVIWDLKGTADDQYYRKVVAQLVFYDIAVWASSKRKTRSVGLMQPMCNERLLAWEVTDDARRQLLARIERYAHDVWDGEKSCTTDTKTCYFCDVKHACARYAQPNVFDAFAPLVEAFRKAAGEDACPSTSPIATLFDQRSTPSSTSTAVSDPQEDS